ncbi:MAG: hypothetical protein HY254_02040 [Burkholderiales bacterium]|nr:hypothetical protein [Burkholderiales bacterium]
MDIEASNEDFNKWCNDVLNILHHECGAVTYTLQSVKVNCKVYYQNQRTPYEAVKALDIPTFEEKKK